MNNTIGDRAQKSLELKEMLERKMRPARDHVG